MRIHKRYRCDYEHEWIVQTEQGMEDDMGETYCPMGHAAVTCNIEKPADVIQVLIRPAARIVDSATGDQWGVGRYFLILLDNSDHEIGTSSNHYSWDEAIKLASIFTGKNSKTAMEWWERKKP